jgi:hypothetical protein
MTDRSLTLRDNVSQCRVGSHTASASGLGLAGVPVEAVNKSISAMYHSCVLSEILQFSSLRVDNLQGVNLSATYFRASTQEQY